MIQLPGNDFFHVKLGQDLKNQSLLRNFSGFVVLLLMNMACESKKKSDEIEVVSTPDPVFIMTPIHLNPGFDPATQTYGDLDCSDHSESDPFCLMSFGNKAIKNGVVIDKRNPDFGIRTKPNTRIRAGIKGYIHAIERNEPPSEASYAINISTDLLVKGSEGETHMVEYDHVEKVLVKVGDPVEADTEIADASCDPIGSSPCPHGFFEIQINPFGKSDRAHPCPAKFFNDDVKKQFSDALINAQNVSFPGGTSELCVMEEVE